MLLSDPKTILQVKQADSTALCGTDAFRHWCPASQQGPEGLPTALQRQVSGAPGLAPRAGPAVSEAELRAGTRGLLLPAKGDVSYRHACIHSPRRTLL